MNFEISDIDSIPPERRGRIQEKITDIVIETFIKPGDSDYITARLMALCNQHRPFFWPALQAIEKYVKALLLGNGISVKGRGFGHNITEMAEKLANVSDVFFGLSLKPTNEHMELEELNLWGGSDPFEYIREIERYGIPSNRYNYFGADYEASYLPKLDQLIFALRSHCVGSKALYGVGRNTEFDYFAYEQNYSFAPDDYQQGTFYRKFSLGMEVPSIELALKGCYGDVAIYKRWITENIKIKQAEIDEIVAR